MDNVPPTEIPGAQDDALTGDSLHPVVVAGADYAQHAVDWVDGEVQRWAAKIRERPLTSIGIAALAGYVVAAIRRH